MEKKLSKCFALSRFYCRPNKAMHSLKMRKKNHVPENRPAPPPHKNNGPSLARKDFTVT